MMTSSTRLYMRSSLPITRMLHRRPDRSGNLLEVVSVLRDDGSEIAIHAMRMRRTYEPLLRGKGDADD